MTNVNFNQTNANKRTFCDLLNAMPAYKFIINEHNKAELVGKTSDLEALNQAANEMVETLLLGLQSFGTFLAHAMDNSEYKVSRLDLINTGHFFSLIAESANAVNEVALQTREELQRRKVT